MRQPVRVNPSTHEAGRNFQERGQLNTAKWINSDIHFAVNNQSQRIGTSNQITRRFEEEIDNKKRLKLLKNVVPYPCA